MLSRTHKQELANSLTHGLGLLAGMVGVTLLLSLAVRTSSAAVVVSAAVYSFSLLLTYLASTLYHSIQHNEIKRVLHKIDHIAIYFLIAGSYTPFVLIYLDSTTGWTFLAALWSLAAAGVVYKLFWLGKYKRFSLFFYLGMGWMMLFVAKPFLENLPLVCIAWIVIGGFFYTAGVVFFVWKRFTYHHAIWHLFVMGGSLSHYIAVFYGVLIAQRQMLAA